jgi:hypothetical protein
MRLKLYHVFLICFFTAQAFATFKVITDMIEKIKDKKGELKNNFHQPFDDEPPTPLPSTPPPPPPKLASKTTTTKKSVATVRPKTSICTSSKCYQYPTSSKKVPAFTSTTIKSSSARNVAPALKTTTTRKASKTSTRSSTKATISTAKKPSTTVKTTTSTKKTTAKTTTSMRSTTTRKPVCELSTYTIEITNLAEKDIPALIAYFEVMFSRNIYKKKLAVNVI